MFWCDANMTSLPIWLTSANSFLIRPVFFLIERWRTAKTKKQGQNNLTSRSNFQIKLGMVNTQHFCYRNMNKKGMQNFDHSTTLKLVNKQPSGFLFHQLLRCFRVVWSQFWTSSNFLSALESTTNNQEVKRSLYRLQNVNNLSKDCIRVCLTCRSLAE